MLLPERARAERSRRSDVASLRSPRVEATSHLPVPAQVPVIAKSDTLTDEEITEYRALLRAEFDRARIAIVDFDAAPHSVFGDRTFARGRAKGDPLGIVARDGHYPWGSSEAGNRKHGDFALLKELLLSEHTEALVEHAKHRYALYRARRVQKRKLADAAIRVGVLGLLARVFAGGAAPTLGGSVAAALAAVRSFLAALTPAPGAPPPPPPPPPRKRRFEFTRLFERSKDAPPSPLKF